MALPPFSISLACLFGVFTTFVDVTFSLSLSHTFLVFFFFSSFFKSELPDGFFEPAKMGNGCNGGELNDNVFSVMNGQNKKVTVDAAKVSK